MKYNTKSFFLEEVRKKGGFKSYHAHFDKAHLLDEFPLHEAMVDMEKKWYDYRKFKENYTHEDLVHRMNKCILDQSFQNTTLTRTFVDCDHIVKQLPVDAAVELKETWKNKVDLEIAIQPLEGVFGSNREEFITACEKADSIGGLPSRDRGREEDHLDFIMRLSKDLNKKVDVHVDQANAPFERETELLARKTIEHGIEGNVTAVHSISLSCHSKEYQVEVCKMMKDAGMNVVICPSAGISMRQLDQYSAPIHNSLAPLELFIEKEVPVCLGIDNISDLFMPLVDGDFWFEMRLLMEATRIYDLDIMSDFASGRRLN